MKSFSSFLTLCMLSSFFLSCTKGKADSDSFFIEANINGKKWRSTSTAGYIGNASDNSKIKLYIPTTVPATGTFHFFSTASLRRSNYLSADLVIQNLIVAPFDSKFRFKWETTLESNIERFDIDKSTSQNTYERIATIPAKVNSNTLTSYSFTDENMTTSMLGRVNYRIFIASTAGTSRYIGPIIPTITGDSQAQIFYQTADGRYYFSLDNDQNQITVSYYDPATSERRGSFSFKYKDDLGNIVEVTNGKFHLKL